MMHLRAVKLAALCLVGGLITSYAVAWWAMYRFDDLAKRPAALEDLAPPSDWPAPVPPHWPSIAALREQQAGSPALQPHVQGWHSGTVDIRYTFAEDLHSTIFMMMEVQTGWPARSASRFGHRDYPFSGPSSGEPDETRPWFTGLHLVDRPRLDSKGGPTLVKSPVYFPLRPVWPGVAINTLGYGFTFWAITIGTLSFVRSRRRRLGLCVRCRYPVGASPLCTECGTPVAKGTRA